MTKHVFPSLLLGALQRGGCHIVPCLTRRPEASVRSLQVSTWIRPNQTVLFAARSVSTTAVPTDETTAGSTAPVAEQPWCMRTALFGLTDRHTGMLTHLSPRQRLRLSMPLLPRRVRRHIAKESLWFKELVQFERAVPHLRAPCAEPSCSPTDVVLPTPPPISLMPNDTRTATGDEKGVEGHVAEPVEPTDAIPEAVAIGTLADVASTAAGSSDVTQTSPPRLPSAQHLEVVGRAKIIRYLLAKYLHSTGLWWDEAQELVEGAVQTLASAGDIALTADDLPAVCASASRHVLPFTSPLATRPGSVAIWSDAVVQLLMEFTVMTPDEFNGPRALWLAHVVHRRADVKLLTSPQCPPFSFGELHPTVAPSDMQPRQYTLASTPTAENAADEDGLRAPDTEAFVLPDKPWSTLSEREQNEFLFGPVGADVAARMTTEAASGIYVVDHQERPAKDRAVGGDVDVTGWHSAEEGAAPPDAAAAKEAKRLQTAEADERRVLRRYQVDEHYLGMLLPDVRSPVHPSRHDMTVSPGVNSAAHDGNRVQVDRLWTAFQSASFTTLLDDYVAVRASLDHLQRQVAEEVSAQSAFLLLFFARDEVRLVTAPEQTSALLWCLHQRLLAALVHVVTAREDRPESGVRQTVPRFADLSRQDQLSFACFGCTHLPWPTEADASELLCQQRDTAAPLASACPDATALYHALAATYSTAPSHRMDPAAPPMTPATREANLARGTPTEPVPFLTDVESWALEYCFPRCAEEVWEWRRMHETTSSSSIATDLNADTSLDGGELLPLESPPIGASTASTMAGNASDGGAGEPEHDGSEEAEGPDPTDVTVSPQMLLEDLLLLTAAPEKLVAMDAYRDILPVLERAVRYVQQQQQRAPGASSKSRRGRPAKDASRQLLTPTGRKTIVKLADRVTGALVKRGRGRPCKTSVLVRTQAHPKATTQRAGKKRGRPRKLARPVPILPSTSASPAHRPRRKRGRPRLDRPAKADVDDVLDV